MASAAERAIDHLQRFSNKPSIWATIDSRPVFPIVLARLWNLRARRLSRRSKRATHSAANREGAAMVGSVISNRAPPPVSPDSTDNLPPC